MYFDLLRDPVTGRVLSIKWNFVRSRTDTVVVLSSVCTDTTKVRVIVSLTSPLLSKLGDCKKNEVPFRDDPYHLIEPGWYDLFFFT